jgi:glycosyltransferase involved in cell wall biosynthesis
MSRRVDFHIRGNSFSRWKYGQVDCFITASNAIHQMLVGDGVPPHRIVTVHEGVDVERVASTEPAALHKELWLPTQAPIVGNIAALVPHKGQRFLIDAVPIVLRDVPDARFVILGEGELRGALERQVSDARLVKHVFLPGFRADVLAALRAFDVFVMSSVTEGLGTSLLDAMAASRAIVATRAGGIPEVVADGETGFLVEPRDKAAMAAAIVRLLLDAPLRSRMGAAGLARVRERFSADRMVSATLEVYARLAGTRRPADIGHRAAPA